MTALDDMLKPINKLGMKIVRVRLEARLAKEGIDAYSKADSEAMGLPAKLAKSSKLLLELEAQYEKDLGEFRKLARAHFREASAEERKELIARFPVVDFGKSNCEEKE